MALLRGTVCAFLVPLAFTIREDSLGGDLATEGGHTVGGDYKIIHLTDPQLGLRYNFGDEKHPEKKGTWEEEKDMVTWLVGNVTQKCKYSTVLIGGDMMDYWPDREGTGPYDKVAVDQVADAKKALSGFTPEKVVYTAGNHDIGDKPNKATLKFWMKTWGPLWDSFFIGKTPCLQITSQFYWTPEEDLSTEAGKAKNDQTSWLEDGAFSNDVVQGMEATGRLMIFTHIPPFMSSPTEHAGWANWNEDSRKKILGILEQKLPANVRLIWVCGHFHTNVEFKSRDMDIIVTSAAGSTMWWQQDGVKNEGQLEPEAAMNIASQDIRPAFKGSILDKGGKAENVKPEETRSGLRIITLKSKGYESEWYTLSQIKSPTWGC